MNTKIVAIVAALVVVVGGTSIFIITNDDNDKNLPTQHYVGPSVYTYNTAVVDSEKNISAPLPINGISSLSEDKISDAVSNMYMGTKNNTMYFRIASLPNSVTAILSATYGGSGGTMSFTHQTTSAISTSVEESISNTISETIASEFNFETSKGISESITASVSASVEAGLEFPIVSAKATKTAGLSNTIGASLETTCGWSDSVSSQESKTFCNSYAQTVTTTYGSGAEWKDIETKFGCFYRIAEVTTVHVVEAIEFEYSKVSESFVVKDITYLTIFENKPAVYLQEGDSIDFINTNRSDTNCSLTKEEIEYASSEYENYLVKNSEECTITFYADANGNEILSSEHYIRGSPIPETSIPKYENDRFIGWTNEANGNKIVEVDKIATTDVSYYPVLIEDGFKKISTYEELVLIENDLNGKYVLINDIDLNGRTFVPIGYRSSQKPVEFKGLFEGSGYTISNFKIENNYESGLFARNSGCIKNLNITDVTITYSSEFLKDDKEVVCGILVARNWGNIENCDVSKSTITTTMDDTYDTSGKNDIAHMLIGGIAGNNKGSGIISQCSVIDLEISSKIKSCDRSAKYEDAGAIENEVNFTPTINAGGLVGYAGGTLSNCYVDNITIDGVINSTIRRAWLIENYTPNQEIAVGGLVGHISKSDDIDTTIISCYTNDVQISITGTANGAEFNYEDNIHKYSGTFAGLIDNDDSIWIHENYAKSDPIAGVNWIDGIIKKNSKDLDEYLGLDSNIWTTNGGLTNPMLI